MHIIRRPAKQGHAIPSTAMAPRGPFSPELYAMPRVVVDDNDPDIVYPLYANAQNNFQAPPMYRCTLCGATVPEPELDSHECDDDEDDDG